MAPRHDGAHGAKNPVTLAIVQQSETALPSSTMAKCHQHAIGALRLAFCFYLDISIAVVTGWPSGNHILRRLLSAADNTSDCLSSCEVHDSGEQSLHETRVTLRCQHFIDAWPPKAKQWLLCKLPPLRHRTDCYPLVNT
eukprot:6084469-Pleurochrysis_carterae.AAC.3